MVAWSGLPAGFTDADWDEATGTLPDFCIFQSSDWARHKRDFGWEALRFWAGTDPRRPAAAAQLLHKRFPLGLSLLWGRGGPMGDPLLWGDGLRRALKDALPGRLLYLRVCSYREQDQETPSLMASQGWKRPVRPLNRNTTFVLELDAQRDPRAALSSNWAHNLRRAEKRCPPPQAWAGQDVSGLVETYRAMQEYKGLSDQPGEDELRSLLPALGGRVLLVTSDDAEGKPMALRACAVQGDKAWDLLAASTEAGRKCYASYLLLWTLISTCRERGARRYDLGGADPDTAKGVYDFKKGTGASFIEYVGEWDWANPPLLRGAVSTAVALRARGL